MKPHPEHVMRRAHLGLTITGPHSANRAGRRARRITRQTMKSIYIEGWPYLISAALVLAACGFITALLFKA